MGGIGAVVLAAGNSSRLGQPKQLLTFADGETLVHSTVRAARETGCRKICVVTGAAHDQVAEALSDLHPMIVRNRDWARGIGSSIRLGVSQLPDLAAIVLLTCDQPALDRDIIRALITRRDETGCAIIASHYGGALGTPALFDCSCFAELQSLPDETGAKLLIESEPGRVAQIEFPAGAFDLDSPSDVQAWRERCPA